jgi:hypothetical protein
MMAWAKTELTAAEQTALHLLGVAASAEESIHTIVTTSPLAEDALAFAAAHDVPVAEIGADLTAVIAEGQKLATALASPPVEGAAPRVGDPPAPAA